MSTLDIAVAYATETGHPVFPCLATKAPACASGFKAASSDPDAIKMLWQCHPGPLIGMPTGEASGLAALDIDAVKHPESAAWFDANYFRLGDTLTIETRSGGWHCFYQNRPGLTCTTKLFKVPGVDIRSTGGYVILWGLHGTRTLTQADPATWPDWLVPQPPRRPERADMPPRFATDSGIDRILRFLASASEGERNAKMFWASCRLSEMNGLPSQHVVALIKGAADRLGYPVNEAEKTALSAIRRVRV